MTPSEQIARDYQREQYDRLVQEMRPGPPTRPYSGSGPAQQPIRDAGNPGASSGTVIRYLAGGAAIGLVIAVLIALEYPRNLSNLLVNWGLFGAFAGGMFGLTRRH